MRKGRHAPFGGLLGGLLLAILATGAVAAYAGQVAGTITASGPSGPQTCETPVTVTALVQELGGAVIEGQPVTWSFESGNVAGDKILDTTTTTNSSGIATTQIQFACSPHSVTILATADDVSGSVLVATSGEGLPRTDTTTQSSLPAILLAALAVLIGSGTILRRFASARR